MKADTGDETRRQEQRVLTSLLAVMGGTEMVCIAGLRSKKKDLIFPMLSLSVCEQANIVVDKGKI